MRQMNNETWRDIQGYEGLYQVSDTGRVRSVDRSEQFKRNGKISHRIRHGRFLGQTADKHGYLRVHLAKDGKCKRFFVHRLVATAYISKPDDKPQVNHMNGNRTDNRVCNLEWVSAQENVCHAFRVIGRKPSRHRPVICLETGGVYGSVTEAAKTFGIDKSHLVACCRGRRNQAGNYHFKYFCK